MEQRELYILNQHTLYTTISTLSSTYSLNTREAISFRRKHTPDKNSKCQTSGGLEETRLKCPKPKYCSIQDKDSHL